jgi:hypothetical protein
MREFFDIHVYVDGKYDYSRLEVSEEDARLAVEDAAQGRSFVVVNRRGTGFMVGGNAAHDVDDECVFCGASTKLHTGCRDCTVDPRDRKIHELNEINDFARDFAFDWRGEWWITSPDGQAEMRVTEEGEPRTYADALAGIREAHEQCSNSDYPTPFYEWALDCVRYGEEV